MIGVGVRLRILHHGIDLGIGEPAGACDGDLLFLAGSSVFGTHIQDAIGIDVNGHLNLRDASGSQRDSHQVEFPQ